MSRSFVLRAFTGLTALSIFTACGAPAGVSSLEANGEALPTAETQAMRIQFTPEVNGVPFRCGQSYTGIGSTQSTLTPKDFRLYVNQVQLVNAAGESVPMTLTQNAWQHDDLALLDFEDKSGDCESGTVDTNFEITGTVPAGEYTGLKFELGVPFAMNHQDASKAPSPLNLTSMFWVWRFGYKFTRIDFATTGQPQGYFIHLGSTGCTGTATKDTEHTMHVQHEGHDHGEEAESLTTAPLQCEYPNRGTIALNNFQPESDSIVVDLGAVLKDSNVDINQPETPGGCMSGEDDSDCDAIMPALGVAFKGKPAQQRLFSVRSAQ